MANVTDIPHDDAQPVNAKRNRQPLYAARKKVYPKRVTGRFRRFKWLVMLITLGIYYLLPWVRWDRGPYAPDQAVLVDMAHRRFYFFFIEIWPQEFFFIAGLLVMAGIGLFLITSTIGRAWCGYTCPQTVWVDLFIAVERLIEGDRNARIKLDKSPWTAEKIIKRTAVHACWLLIGVMTGGAWIFYFADAPTLLVDFAKGQAPMVAYTTVAILTATTYVFGGLMREQVCTYMCPWPRIQGAMLDENSLTVTYNAWRGEPRSAHAKKAAAAGQVVGDCVDCNACVAVCPMGIDIRDGQQLECITCALCIDACDNVMDKLGKERGLISYATLSEYNDNMALATANGTQPIDPRRVRNPDGTLSDKVARFDWRHVFRLRTLIYATIFAAVGLGMLYVLVTRDRLDVNVLHDRNPQYVVLSDGSIRNGYTVKLLNMIPQPRELVLSIEGLEGATMTSPELEESGTELRLTVQPDRLRPIHIFVSQEPQDHGHRHGSRSREELFHFVVQDVEGGERAVYRAKFIRP